MSDTSGQQRARGRRAAVAIGAVSIVVLALVGLLVVGQDIETSLAAESEASLRSLGYDDVEVRVDGRDVAVVGTVRDDGDIATIQQSVAAGEGVRAVDVTGLRATDGGAGGDPSTDDGGEGTADPAPATGEEGGDGASDDDAAPQDAADDATAPGVVDDRPRFEVATRGGELVLSGAVGVGADKNALLSVAIGAVGDDDVAEELDVVRRLRSLGSVRAAQMELLVNWVADSAGEPLRNGVGFAVDGPDVRVFGEVAEESSALAEQAGPQALGPDGTFDSSELTVQEDLEFGREAEGIFEVDGETRYGPPVLFDTGGSQLDPEDVVAINEVAAALRSNDVEEVLVVGYADATGSTAVNMQLSQARAETVAQALRGLVPGVQTEVLGRGEEALRENSLQSRRVEVFEPRDDG